MAQLIDRFGQIERKKSVLLRIQKPFSRNRDNEESHYSGYFDEMNLSSYGDNDQFLYLDGVDEKQERKGSPMEIDVIFKSNSTVAKAIVAPSSSAVVSNTNLTPKSGKIRKVQLPSKVSSSSQTNNLYESNMKLDSSEDGNNASSSSRKELKKSKMQISPCVIYDMHDDNSQPCFSGINDSITKFIVERSKHTLLSNRSSDVGISKTSLLSVIKKKRVVNLKLKQPDKHLSCSQPNEKVDEPVKKDSSTFIAPAATLPIKGKKTFGRKNYFC
ncbi:hypothetical protein ACOSQ4_005203 [Xanthoceras sorbifolium]